MLRAYGGYSSKGKNLGTGVGFENLSKELHTRTNEGVSKPLFQYKEGEVK